MVLEGYPVGFPMECLEDHPQIESAFRLKVRSSKEETRQVLVTIVEDPPSKIHLGIFGTFSLREYHKEPLRCSKCQWFDHHISKCRSKPRCGVCSEDHLSDICFRKIKEGSRLTAKCPNCGLGHHAWKPICEERRKRLNIPGHRITIVSHGNLIHGETNQLLNSLDFPHPLSAMPGQFQLQPKIRDPHRHPL